MLTQIILVRGAPGNGVIDWTILLNYTRYSYTCLAPPTPSERTVVVENQLGSGAARQRYTKEIELVECVFSDMCDIALFFTCFLL